MSSFDDAFESFISKHKTGAIKEDGIDDIFKKYDKDGNGYIEKKELDAFLQDIFSQKLSSDSLEEFKSELLHRLDKNNDGKIDKNELKSCLPTEENFLKQFCSKNICGVDFIKIWNHYDVNSNGSLEGDELERFFRDLTLKCHPNKPLDEAFVKRMKTRLLEKLNKGDDGSLSRNDLFVWLNVDATSPSFQGKSTKEFEEIFAGYDKDNSGTIEGEELAQLLADLLVLDGDGITAQDMKEFSNTVLLKLDGNGDNKIQKAELKDFLKIQD